MGLFLGQVGYAYHSITPDFAKLIVLLFEVQVYICCLFADGDVANGN